MPNAQNGAQSDEPKEHRETAQQSAGNFSDPRLSLSTYATPAQNTVAIVNDNNTSTAQGCPLPPGTPSCLPYIC